MVKSATRVKMPYHNPLSPGHREKLEMRDLQDQQDPWACRASMDQSDQQGLEAEKARMDSQELRERSVLREQWVNQGRMARRGSAQRTVQPTAVCSSCNHRTGSLTINGLVNFGVKSAASQISLYSILR
ncbi:hypothetical protein OESDEN_17710 [Oesophagostomum dentatum]|uniref:Uncharacterized protein n=1 Tax=Oesophagostomum dentatum TaxID=61180 RepID=A0A0B1SFE2_OESDE|nr:hypothetical protein OESDEN_17710 [Oesophagostomum dentatum]